jgi:hypothetical protein
MSGSVELARLVEAAREVYEASSRLQGFSNEHMCGKAETPATMPEPQHEEWLALVDRLDRASRVYAQWLREVARRFAITHLLGSRD